MVALGAASVVDSLALHRRGPKDTACFKGLGFRVMFMFRVPQKVLIKVTIVVGVTLRGPVVAPMRD